MIAGSLLRLAGLSVRLLCPIAILAISGAPTLGQYYLFVGLFSLAVGIGGLELSTAFSRKFLAFKLPERRSVVFTRFITTQVFVTSLVMTPLGLIISVYLNLNLYNVPAFIFLLVSESCATELAKFYWNIGNSNATAYRDFFRSVIFSTTVTTSIWLSGDFLTPTVFMVIGAGNTGILFFDFTLRRSRKQTQSKMAEFSASRLSSSAYGSIAKALRSVRLSLPQFLHMQALAVQPVAERTLINAVFGLPAVGAYGLFTSAMQASSGILLAPKISDARRAVLSAANASDFNKFPRKIVSLMNFIFTHSIFFLCSAILMIYITKYEGIVLDETTITIAVVAYFSSVAAMFCSAISVMWTVLRVPWAPTIFTLVCYTPIVLASFVRWPNWSSDGAVCLIAAVAATQIAGRLIAMKCLIHFYSK